jgi:hypothetical protein
VPRGREAFKLFWVHLTKPVDPDALHGLPARPEAANS